MRAKLATVGLLVALAAGMAVPTAGAETGTPVDCPGMVQVRGGYKLTQDTTCDLTWMEDNTVINLGGHRLTGTLLPGGHRQTVRNGTLITTGDFWANASDFRVSHLSVRPPTPGGCSDFCIEAGDVTIGHSTFQDIGGIALDFFFGSEGATIRHTDFLRNGTGISIQGDDGITIEKNRFIGNETGLNLYTEDGLGVNDHTIRANLFRQNQWGLRMTADDVEPFETRILSGNRVTDNRFAQNRGSGLLIEVICYPDWGDPCDLPTDNYLDVNHFWANGDHPTEPDLADDGVTARGIDRHDEADPTDHPELLAGFRLARNRAHHNADLGFDVAGVTDGRGNRAWSNSNPAQCVGLPCLNNAGPKARAGVAGGAAVAVPAFAPLEQLEHEPSTEAGG